MRPPGFARAPFVGAALALRVEQRIARAHGAVKNEIRRGRLARPTCCQRCALPRPVTAHHADYLAPLSVLWVCDRCHREEHRHLASIGRDPRLALTAHLRALDAREVLASEAA